MAELKVNLEEGNGLYLAHVVDFLGCFARAETRSEVIDALLKDVKQYSEWLLTKDAGKFYKKQAKNYLAGINELAIIEEFTGVEKLGDPKGTTSLFSFFCTILSVIYLLGYVGKISFHYLLFYELRFSMHSKYYLFSYYLSGHSCEL